MLSSFKNMFKVPELRKKILFTLIVIGLFRLGTHVPVPGIDFEAVKQLKSSADNNGVLGFLNLFSGGALTQFAIFALGIMPYITSSIIMQLLTVVIPKLGKWSKEGASGQKKITQWTRYLTIGLALMQGTGLTFVFHNGGSGFLTRNGNAASFDLLPNFTVPRVSLVVLTLVAGTAMVMWLGECITQRGIGNGASILIFTNVVSRLPSEGGRIYRQEGPWVFAVIMAIVVGMIVAIIIVENGQRRIPVQFAKRMVGRRMYGGQSTYIPLKVNQAGVVPIIFASSILYFPVLLSNVVPWTSVKKFIDRRLTSPDNVFYVLLEATLIIFFAYFYTAISFDPHEQADTIRKQGGYIQGIRPGIATERHLSYILNRITLAGASFIAIIASVPAFVLAIFGVKNFGFGGTTILIAVGVALETMKQIDSQLMMRNYEGFLEGSSARRRPTRAVN